MIMYEPTSSLLILVNLVWDAFENEMTTLFNECVKPNAVFYLSAISQILYCTLAIKIHTEIQYAHYNNMHI